SRRRHTRCLSDWSSDVCSSDLDDTEYTARILLDGRGYLAPRSIVEHRTPTRHTAVDDDHRFYYHARNTVLMLRGTAWRRSEKPRSEERRVGKEGRLRGAVEPGN